LCMYVTSSSDNMMPSRRVFQGLTAVATRSHAMSSAVTGRVSTSRLTLFPTSHSSPRYRLQSRSPTFIPLLFCRQNSMTGRTPSPLTDNRQPPSPADVQQNQARLDQEPTYLIAFTCKPCSHRSSHQISKHGYHKGTVLITCPGCLNRHIISDHLKIFSDDQKTLEDILAEKGQTVMKGKLEGDMEWWEDGTVKSREQPEMAPNKGDETHEEKP